MSEFPVSVVKIGGSLLTSSNFPRRLRTWLNEKTAARPDTHFVLVAGGGQWVEAIRQLDAHSPLGDERAHWMCVAIMDVTAGLVGAMVPDLFQVKSLARLEARLHEPGITLFAPCDFVERDEATRAGTRLPANWSVTSDSIAARLAIVLGAQHLILLKSILPPVNQYTDGWLGQLAVANYVDGFLPAFGAELPPIAFETLMPPYKLS